MARVTVEDCILKVPNRFDLVMFAAQRAREIAAGGALTVDRDNDKNPVVSLREIADETVDIEELQESLVLGLQKHVENDDVSEDELDETTGLIAEETGIAVAGQHDTASAEGDDESEEADEESSEDEVGDDDE